MGSKKPIKKFDYRTRSKEVTRKLWRIRENKIKINKEKGNRISDI